MSQTTQQQLEELFRSFLPADEAKIAADLHSGVNHHDPVRRRGGTLEELDISDSY
jgi:hypothetical protein